jgi:hypothetical protein
MIVTIITTIIITITPINRRSRLTYVKSIIIQAILIKKFTCLENNFHPSLKLINYNKIIYI